MDKQDKGSAQAGTVLGSCCPSAPALRSVAGKWSLEAIAALRGGPLRNHELLRALNGISPKVLAQTLRELEAGGLVVRTEYESSVRHVEYALTERAHALSAALAPVDRWALEQGRGGDSAPTPGR